MIAWLYVAFIFFVLAALAADLFIFNRRAHVIELREALGWAAFWISLGLGFTGFVYYAYEYHWLGIGVATGLDGRMAALQYLTGYIIEESLSVDNMVVFAMVFSFFQVPQMYQHRVLFWGIVGALIMRGIMIAAGTALLHQFSWITYVFGALLLFSAAKLLWSGGHHVDPEHNLLVRTAKRFYPVTVGYRGEHFMVVENGKRMITPLFLVLLFVESTDLFFAIDSIPAVLAVTSDPFLVFTSNIFAILGLRAIYFALAGLIYKFKYLQASLVVLLGFVGVKMLLAHTYPIPIVASLTIIISIFVVGILASLLPLREIVAYLTLNLNSVAEVSIRHARRVVIFLIGSTVILIGVAMMVLPGPAFIVIPTGLAILATEFLWARKLLKKVIAQVKSVANSVTGTPQDTDEDTDKDENKRK